MLLGGVITQEFLQGAGRLIQFLHVEQGGGCRQCGRNRLGAPPSSHREQITLQPWVLHSTAVGGEPSFTDVIYAYSAEELRAYYDKLSQ